MAELYIATAVLAIIVIASRKSLEKQLTRIEEKLDRLLK